MLMFDEQNRIVFRAENITDSAITTEPDKYSECRDFIRRIPKAPGFTTVKLKLEGDENGDHYHWYAYDDVKSAG